MSCPSFFNFQLQSLRKHESGLVTKTGRRSLKPATDSCELNFYQADVRKIQMDADWNSKINLNFRFLPLDALNIALKWQYCSLQLMVMPVRHFWRVSMTPPVVRFDLTFDFLLRYCENENQTILTFMIHYRNEKLIIFCNKVFSIACFIWCCHLLENRVTKFPAKWCWSMLKYINSHGKYPEKG